MTRDHSNRLLTLSQGSYLETMLKRFDIAMCKPIDTPICKSIKLTSDQGPTNEQDKEVMRKKPYAQIVGSFMYVMLCMRPGLVFAMGFVSRFLSNIGLQHWYTIKRILRYIKGTVNLRICYQGEVMELCGYSDADWANDLDQRKSTTGYVFTLEGVVVSWDSKKQNSTAMSIAEAEYIACSIAVQEALWLKYSLTDLEIIGEKQHVPMNVDNTSAISMVNEQKLNS